jgi:VCBS repeat protein
MGSDETRIAIYLGDGVGGFNKQGDFVVNPQAGSLAVGDLNHDGNLDLVVGGAGPENETGLFVSTDVGDGAGNFIIGQIIGLGPGAPEGEMALGDFNENGNLDVAFPFFSFQGTTSSTTEFIFPGYGTGHLRRWPGRHPRQAGSFHSDSRFHQDGHLDLAVTNRTDGTLSILFGDGSGTFPTHATIPVAVLPIP